MFINGYNIPLGKGTFPFSKLAEFQAEANLSGRGRWACALNKRESAAAAQIAG